MDLSEDEGWREEPNVRTCRPYARLPTPREAMRGIRARPRAPPQSPGIRRHSPRAEPCSATAQHDVVIDVSMLSI